MPTASGLVRLYSEGVQDRNYFVATLQAVQQCINLANTRQAYNSPALQGIYIGQRLIVFFVFCILLFLYFYSTQNFMGLESLFILFFYIYIV